MALNLDRLSNKAVFPTRNHRWVSLSGNPLMIDNDELAQLFSSVDALPLLKASSTDRRRTVLFSQSQCRSLCSSRGILPTMWDQISFINDLHGTSRRQCRRR